MNKEVKHLILCSLQIHMFTCLYTMICARKLITLSLLGTAQIEYAFTTTGDQIPYTVPW